MNEEHLERVSSAIARHVIAFVNSHGEWHVESLRQYVFDNVNGYVAPASPDRILRALRQKGVIDYSVISRSQSLYRSIPKESQGELF